MSKGEQASGTLWKGGLMAKNLDLPFARELKELLSGISGFTGGFTTLKLKGDASYRSYYRIHSASGGAESLILMQWDPAVTNRSEEISGKTTVTELPFLNVQRYLSGGGILVPAIVAEDTARGFVLLEDLGDMTLERVLSQSPGRFMELYRGAVDNLVAIQALGEKRREPSCIAFSRAFNEDLYNWEFAHFAEYCIESRTGEKIPHSERQAMKTWFERLSVELDAIPKGFTHRDYQSRNLMLFKNELHVIDFQDALLGPPQYDLVALLKDSYVKIPEEQAETLVSHYLERRAEAGLPLDPGPFRRGFKLQAIQRKLKDAGRFVFIDRVKKNSSFLPNIPQSLEYVWRYLGNDPDLAGFAGLLKKFVPEFT
jgi:aminoglycoside/choline kinase family phosphotransferase